MRRYLLLIMLAVVSLSVHAQRKAFERAIKAGRTSGTYYSMNPSEYTITTSEEIRRYAKENNIYINRLIEDDVRVYGDVNTGCIYVEFMPMSEMDKFNKETPALDINALLNDPLHLKVNKELDAILAKGNTVSYYVTSDKANYELARELLNARHIPFYKHEYGFWSGHEYPGIFFTKMSAIGPNVLKAFGSTQSLSDFKNKVEVLFFVGTSSVNSYEIMTKTMRWTGKVVDGKPDGYGQALSIENGQAYYMTGTYKQGLPDGDVYCAYISLSDVIRNSTDKFSVEAPRSNTYKIASGSGYFSFLDKPELYDGKTQQVVLKLNSGEKLLSAFENGKAMVLKDGFKRYIDRSGKFVGYPKAFGDSVRKELQSYCVVGKQMAQRLINDDVLRIGMDKELQQARTKSVNYNLINFSHIRDYESELTTLVSKKEFNDVLAMLALENIFRQYDDTTDVKVLYRREISAQYDKAVSYEHRETLFGLIPWGSSTERTDFRDDTKLALENRHNTFLNEVKVVDANYSSLPANWDTYKNRLLDFFSHRVIEYGMLGSEPANVFYSRQNAFFEQLRKDRHNERVRSAERELVGVRIDGKRSVSPQGWVPANDGIFFGLIGAHPGFSEKSGDLYLENGTHVKWEFYGNGARIIDSSDYYIDEKSFDSATEMMDYILSQAYKHKKEELDRVRNESY